MYQDPLLFIWDLLLSRNPLQIHFDSALTTNRIWKNNIVINAC